MSIDGLNDYFRVLFAVGMTGIVLSLLIALGFLIYVIVGGE